MAAREFHAEATAFQIVALLERYEADVEPLVSADIDLDLYARVSGHIDQMRLLCASLPVISVAWVHLLISHTELMHSLWRSPGGETESPAIDRCRSDLFAAARDLRAKCMYQFSRARLH